ncbi:OmpA family protein [Tatumella ptyseos]|uniref:OmpA family protein n=1 Tax=Tatumella ptyseos TaxID=82987 RepID=UPI0026F278E1|nr:OmpA family protein [Tatumella ptyseos]WKX25578.1 OmpA family protein [Tatumella ptyseos]
MRCLLVFFSLLITIMLSGCQTDGPFNAGQKKALQQEGFQYLGSHWELGINDKILFGIEQSSLTPESRQKISTIANNLKRVGIVHVAFNGHTDNYGKADYNQQLSYLRAKSVARVWMESTGGDLKDITVRGYGMSKPIATNRTGQGRAMNRRVAIVIEAP